jgi:hypothetical protein
MTINEMRDELDKLQSWRGGDGNTPVHIGANDSIWEITDGQIDNGCAVFYMDDGGKLDSTQEALDSKLNEADDDIDKMKSRAADQIADLKEGAITALREAIQAVKDISEDV